jgi:hypothetical protein
VEHKLAAEAAVGHNVVMIGVSGLKCKQEKLASPQARRHAYIFSEDSRLAEQVIKSSLYSPSLHHLLTVLLSLTQLAQPSAHQMVTNVFEYNKESL